MGRKTDVLTVGFQHVLVDVREGRGGTAGTVDCMHTDALPCAAPLRRTSRPTQQDETATPEDQGQATTHEDRTR
ncbi:hypothetical protein MTO96_043429 [Rhipicephalus appendiculatus]